MSVAKDMYNIAINVRKKKEEELLFNEEVNNEYDIVYAKIEAAVQKGEMSVDISFDHTKVADAVIKRLESEGFNWMLGKFNIEHRYWMLGKFNIEHRFGRVSWELESTRIFQE